MRKIFTVAEKLLFKGKPFRKTPVFDDCSSTPFSIGVKVMSLEASAGVYCMALPPAANITQHVSSYIVRLGPR